MHRRGNRHIWFHLDHDFDDGYSLTGGDCRLRYGGGRVAMALVLMTVGTRVRPQSFNPCLCVTQTLVTLMPRDQLNEVLGPNRWARPAPLWFLAALGKCGNGAHTHTHTHTHTHRTHHSPCSMVLAKASGAVGARQPHRLYADWSVTRPTWSGKSGSGRSGKPRIGRQRSRRRRQQQRRRRRWRHWKWLTVPAPADQVSRGGLSAPRRSTAAATTQNSSAACKPTTPYALVCVCT